MTRGAAMYEAIAGACRPSRCSPCYRQRKRWEWLVFVPDLGRRHSSAGGVEIRCDCREHAESVASEYPLRFTVIYKRKLQGHLSAGMFMQDGTRPRRQRGE